MLKLNKLLLIFLVISGVIFLSGCISQEQPQGTFVQGPNRAIVYQNYLLLDPAAGGNGTTIAIMNGTGAAITNTSYHPDYPRNIIVNASEISTSATITVTVTGVDISDNAAKTETLTLTSPNGVATGNIAWYNITSVRWATPATTVQISAGWGTKFGLPNMIKKSGYSQANSDVLGVTVAGTGKAVSAQTISSTYNTITFDTAPDASKDYVVFYRGYAVGY